MARIRGIVMENKDGRAVILSPSGEYKRVRVSHPIEVGEIYDGPVARSPWRYALAAGLILALTMGYIDFFTVKAYAQVSSSIELGINRWNRVVTVRALDEEGEAILQQSDFKGKKVDEAVAVIEEKAKENNGINKEGKDPKVFPEQASGKGNKDQDFIDRVEQNMNQEQQKTQDNGNNGNSNSNNNSSNSNSNNNANSEKEKPEKANNENAQIQKNTE